MYSAHPPVSMSRERRQWTAEEDELLRRAVDREEPGNPAPSKWHAIAQHVPNRTNKDCRKRWYAKMNSDVVKGGWAPDEDQRLLQAINAYGTRWSLVASMVQTRNSDQCAKRWCDTLNPAIDRTAWTTSQDDLLIQAVNEHGKVWTKIVQTFFPGRTGLSAKNRYNSITRSEGHATTSRRRSSPDSSPSPTHDFDHGYARYSTANPSPYDLRGLENAQYNLGTGTGIPGFLQTPGGASTGSSASSASGYGNAHRSSVEALYYAAGLPPPTRYSSPAPNNLFSYQPQTQYTQPSAYPDTTAYGFATTGYAMSEHSSGSSSRSSSGSWGF
ncbi:hypothetical protein MKEN_01321500 [Mycena kentingensis (nom. inval.)]|nr:hypothetical protein MKEN_01321500 [Mycena kentingensis (nom. inval.)]